MINCKEYNEVLLNPDWVFSVHAFEYCMEVPEIVENWI